MRLALQLAALAAVLCLAACGGSGSSTTTGGGPATAPVPREQSAASGLPVPRPGRRPSPTRCTAANLTPVFLAQQGATGHGLLAFALHNRSRSRCHTFGYPGVLFLDARGRALATVPRRTTRDFFGAAPLVRIALAPGQSASFRLGVTHQGAAGTGRACATAAMVQLIPPDDTRRLRVPVPGGAYECGTVTVTPLQPGRSALR